MQLIWVSGPTAKVVTVSITLRKVLLGLGVMAMFFTLLGVVFYFVGLHIAVESSPALVLTPLQQRVQQMLDPVQDLERQKRQMADLIGWDAGRERLNQGVFGLRQGQGGPFNSLPWLGLRSRSLATQLNQTAQEFESLEQWLRDQDRHWAQEHQRLQQLPASLPLHEPFAVTSGFGVRLDPFSRFPSLHAGLDFIAGPGTPIRGTAPAGVGMELA